MTFEESRISVYAENIPGIEVAKVADGNVTRWTISDSNEISKIAEWAKELVLKKVTFTEGQYPGDNDGDIGYLLRTSFGAHMFEFGIYSEDIQYIYVGNDWYIVQNPSNLPLTES
jgi:hypothetical protein